MHERRSSPSGEPSEPTGTTFVFFAAALGITWLLQLPAVLAKEGVIAGPVERFMLPAALGGFGPLLAAILAARLDRKGGVRALLARIRIGKVGVIWHVVALLIFAAIYVAGTAAYRALGGMDAGRWLYPPENTQHVFAMIVMPLVEEPGWRGFALPRLQPRHGALRASLLVGVLWAFWHTMMFILQGATPLIFAVSIANIIAGSVVFSWLYNHTRGSLLIAILAHVGVHWNNPYHALPDKMTPFVVYTMAIAIAACALVFGDRKVWQQPAAQPN
jgi:uncharacterized protein